VIVILVALAAAIGQAFGRFSYGILLPAVRDDLQVSNTIAGLIGATNVSAYLIGTLCVAWATSHFRLITVFRIGLLLAALGLGLASLSTGATTLSLALLITGLGGACLWIPAPAIAAAALSERFRSLAVGLMGSGIGLGIVFVSILSGQLRATVGDEAWSDIYGVQFMLALVLLILIFCLVRHHQAEPSGGAGLGGFGALRRMPGWRPLLLAYAAFGFMYLLVLGFLTSRLEDDSQWLTVDAATAFTLTGIAMIFGGPIFATVAQRIGVRFTLCMAFGLWPLLVTAVLSGSPQWVFPACLGLGLLFSALPTLITLYVVNNTTTTDYGPSFSAATLVFGLAQTLSPATGGLIADATGSFWVVFLLAAGLGFIGLLAAWRLPHTQTTEPS
jgi:predicted MFS family arabinose efflux permease